MLMGKSQNICSVATFCEVGHCLPVNNLCSIPFKRTEPPSASACGLLHLLSSA
jgi:hypothetical protein